MSAGLYMRSPLIFHVYSWRAITASKNASTHDRNFMFSGIMSQQNNMCINL